MRQRILPRPCIEINVVLRGPRILHENVGMTRGDEEAHAPVWAKDGPHQKSAPQGHHHESTSSKG